MDFTRGIPGDFLQKTSANHPPWESHGGRGSMSRTDLPGWRLAQSRLRGGHHEINLTSWQALHFIVLMTNEQDLMRIFEADIHPDIRLSSPAPNQLQSGSSGVFWASEREAM